MAGLDIFRKKIVAWIMMGTFGFSNAHVVGQNQIEHAGIHQETTEIVGTFEQVEEFIEAKTVPLQDFSKAEEKVDVKNVRRSEKIAVTIDVKNQYAPNYTPTGIGQSAEQIKEQVEQGIITQAKQVRDSVVHQVEKYLKSQGMPGTQIRNMEDYSIDYNVKAIHIIVTGYASPEGDMHRNYELSVNRSKQVSQYIGELEFQAFGELGINDTVTPQITHHGGGINTSHPSIQKAVQLLNQYSQSKKININGVTPIINYHLLNKHNEKEVKKFSDILKHAKQNSPRTAQMVDQLLDNVRTTRVTIMVEIEGDAYVVIVTLTEKRTETPLKPTRPVIPSDKGRIIKEKKKLKHLVEKKIGRKIPAQIRRDYNVHKNRPRSINNRYHNLG